MNLALAPRPVVFRDEPEPVDPARVATLLRSTGLFSDEEVTVAGEVVEAYLAHGPASGYRFLFALGDGLLGYSCFGRIPLTRSSFDLYWIAVVPEAQGMGLGRSLVAGTERTVADLGATVLYADTSGRPQYDATRAFYVAAGYREAARFVDFYGPGDAKVVFEKRLVPAR